QFVQKNYNLRRGSPFQAIFKEEHNDFLQVPLAFNIHLLQLNNTSIFTRVGFFAGLWIQSDTKGTIPNAFNSTNSVTENGEVIQNFNISPYSAKGFNSIQNNRFEFGALLSLGLDYAIHSRYIAVLEFAYNYVLTTSSKSTLGYSNRTLISSIGIRYRLMKGK
ncbi:MAG: hypothetical protein AAF551_08330, partial [Bacteroidota bacterium]